MIRIELRGDAEVIARLNSFPASLRTVLRRRTEALVLKLQARVMRKLSGEVLNVVTGALRRSIQKDVTETSTMVRGRVYSTGDVKYGAIHEFGGKTRAHIIVPKKAQALSFMMGGNQVFAKMVRHPGSRMPQRSFLRSSLAEMRDEIVREMTEGVVESALSGNRS